jgi:hypothetical protein
MYAGGVPRQFIASAALVVVSLVSLAARHARAEDSSNVDRALAQSLFDEARTLIEQKRFSEACPKLAESDRLDPGGGTLLNLGVCHENEGKLARAWVELNEAVSRAIRDGRKDREELAREHITALGKRVPRLRVVVAEADAQVTLDGEPVRSLVSPLPLDPGPHVLVVTAHGKRSRTFRADAAADGAVGELVVPALEEAPSGEEMRSRSGQRTVGYVVAGAGLAAVGVGAFFGIRALSKRSDADALCPEKRCANPDAVSAQDDAIAAAWIANVAIGAGLVALGVGGYLALSAGADGKSAQIGARIPLF